jgi:phytoene synthase
VGDAAATPPPANHSAPGAPDTTDLVRTTARAFELDRYLTALLAPRSIRDDLVALAAFAGEIGRIPVFASEPMIGRIRLQWWRDAVAAMDQPGLATGHPIADALSSAVQRHALPVGLLMSAIDAESDRLEPLPFATTAMLLANIEQADGAYFALASQMLGGGTVTDNDRQNRDSPISPPPWLAPAARAYGLARTMIELPVLLANGHVPLPRDRLAAHDITLQNLHLPDARRGLAAIVAELCASANADLETARGAFPARPTRQQRIAILPTALVRPYLRLSELSGPTPPEVRDLLPISRVIRLWAAASLGVF